MAAPKVFVSYSRKDREITERLVDDLQQAGAELWMDVDAIRSGNFVQAIDKALVQCDWLLLVLSPNAIASDYVPEETYTALHRVKQGYMKGVIPVLVASCIPGSIPPQWDVLQRYDASQDYAAALAGVVGGVGLIPLGRTVPKAGYETANYFRRLADLGFTAHSKYGIEYILPPMCIVPAGPFLMGSDPNRDKQAWADEMPQHTVTLPTYEIARFPVTVAEFACFVRVRHRNPDNPSELNENDWYWLKQLSKLDHPVVDVTWDDAVAYATWLADMTGEFWRPPTRAECQKAARGTDGRIYPWGDTFDNSRCNTSESGIETTTPVGSYPSGASPYTVQDMAGNVDEWVIPLKKSDVYDVYTVSNWREVIQALGNNRGPAHGGSWEGSSRSARAAYLNAYTVTHGPTIGFRLVRAAPNS